MKAVPLLLTPLLFLLSACTSTSDKAFQLPMMPHPEVFNATFNPFSHSFVPEDRTELLILYATTREPAEETDSVPFYLNRRGRSIRLGRASVKLNPEDTSWNDMTLFPEIRTRKSSLRLYVNNNEEYGTLYRDISAFPRRSTIVNKERQDSGESFLREINRNLQNKDSSDIYIYVHGYSENFEQPVLTAAQMWHYLGYRGVFIPFSWPSRDKETAYVGDIDTAASSVKAFRSFLEFLAEESDAEKIHILSHSVGTRLVTQALNQISLLYRSTGTTDAKIPAVTEKLGTILLVSSEMDRELFGSYLQDGLLDMADQINIYISDKDKALRVSRWLHNYPRLGEKWEDDVIDPSVISYLNQVRNLHFIDISSIENIGRQGGHFHMTENSLVSSDILAALYSSLPPGKRGLIRHETLPYWIFPEDYIPQLRESLSTLGMFHF